VTITAPWRKVIRDVWRERTRATLVVLAVAVGLASFLAVLSTYTVLRRELNRGYLATNPASAVILTDAIDDALIRSTIAREDVEDADARRVVNGRMQTPDGAWRRLVLFVIRDFQHLKISTVTPEAGAWPPATGEILIERDAFQVAKARIGDIATIETKDGGRHQLRVAGRVHDAGQAQARMENLVYGYIAAPTLAAIGESGQLDRLYVLASGDQFDEARVRRMAGDVKTWLEATGHVVRRMDVPAPGQHPHAVIMGFLLLLMAAFGLFALALSAVIVVNLLLAMLAAERRQIGVMKAIGGTRGQIARLYLAEAGVLGCAALALATPIGLGLGRALSKYFGVLLNFDLASLSSPAWVFGLVLGVALIVPLAAAAYPVAVATDITVREAIDASGLNATRFGAGRLDRLFCGVGRSSRPLLLGIRNSLRRRTRTALTLMTLGSAGAFFISALSGRRLRIGDWLFDKTYAIRSYPEALGRRVFARGRREEAMMAVRRLIACAGLSIDINATRLEVRIGELADSAEVALALVRTGRDFLRFLYEVDVDPGIQWGELAVRMAGRCPICATTLDEPLVRCERCLAPHHQECWDYAGRCSTYGCDPQAGRHVA